MKREHNTGALNCKCDKCGAEAHAIPGTQHRRCGGGEGVAIKGKREKGESSSRGKWSAA